jgi:hypothetical protein
MPTPAEPFERHVVDIGDARTVDVIVFKSTPQTANVEGIEAAFRQVTAGLCEELGVSGALNGRPRILIVQPGPGSDAFIERQNIAKMAFLAGRDFAVSMDLTDSFQRSAHLDAAQVVRIREGDSRRFERLVVAANRVCAAPPDVVLESHATRLLLRGQAESVTIADLHAQGKLRSDFRLGRVAMVGVPVGGEQGDTAFQASRIGGLVAITTRQSETVGPRLGHTPAERLQGTPSIEVWQRNQTPPSHAALFAGRWHGSQVNPIPELVGLYLRGNDAASVQKYADQLRGGAPIVRSLGTDSPEKLFRTVATVRRGLTDPARDSVLIGCKNIEHGTLAKAMYGDGWRVEVVPEQSLSRLQQMATATGFTRVHIVADDRGDSTGDHEASTGSQFPLPMGLDTPPPAFPEHRALAKNYDRAINALKLIFKLAGKEDILDVFEPSWQLIGPAHEDMQDLQDGQYRGFLMSRTRERAAKVAVSKLASILLGKDGTFAKVIDDLIASGRLPKKFGMVKGGWWVGSLTEVIAGASTQIGRGALVPTVAELECYLKAINSACWGIVGGLLSGGNPKAAEAAAIAADLTRDFLADLTEPVFKWWAYRPVRRQMIRDYEIYLERARASGIKPKRFSDMFGFKALKEAGFDEDMIEELDSRADIEIALRRATRRALARRMPSVCGPAQSGGGTSGSDRSRCFPPGFPPPPPPPPPAVAFLVDANLLVWPPDDDDHHDDDPPPPPGGGGARWSDNGGLPPPDGGSGKRRGNDDPPPPGGDPKSNNRFEDNSGGDRRSDDNNPPPNDPGGGKRKPAKVYTDQFGRIVEEYNDHQWVLKKDARGRIVSFKIRILVNGKWRDLDLPDDVYYEILKLIQAGHNVEIVVVRQGHGQIIYIYVDGELRWIITVGPDGKIIDIKRGGVRVRADVRMSQYGEKADTTGWFAFEEDKSAGFSEPLFESTASSTPHRAAPKRTAFLCPFTLFSASPVTER